MFSMSNVALAVLHALSMLIRPNKRIRPNKH